MCDATTGLTVGWAVAKAECDGSAITITYINATTNAQTSTKPASWEYCRPGFSSDTIYSIVEITQAAYDALGSKDPNTLYIIVG